jgi:hypothetical protein
MKNLCACGCGQKVSPRHNSGKRNRVKFAPGCNQSTSPKGDLKARKPGARGVQNGLRRAKLIQYVQLNYGE